MSRWSIEPRRPASLRALQRLVIAARPDDPRRTFLDGLLIGAMVGAAVAGSTVWRRRLAGRRTAFPSPAQPSGSAPTTSSTPRSGARRDRD